MPHYEPGMRILYDAEAKTVTVAFRGRLSALEGRFPTQAHAIKAGEDYCRKRGWNDAPAPTHGRSLLRRPQTFI